MDESSNLYEKNLNLKKDEVNNIKTVYSIEENLVKDLEKSLKNTVEETLEALNSFIDIVQTKNEDPTVIVEAQKIVESINKEISNSYITNINKLSATIKETEVGKYSEEE